MLALALLPTVAMGRGGFASWRLERSQAPVLLSLDARRILTVLGNFGGFLPIFIFPFFWGVFYGALGFFSTAAHGETPLCALPQRIQS